MQFFSIKAITSTTSDTFSSLCLQYNAGCGQESLFEMWSYDDVTISALTDSEVLAKINPKDELISPYFGGSYKIDNVIGMFYE